MNLNNIPLKDYSDATTSFDKLQSSFSEILQEIQEDDNLSKFRTEYTKLYDLLEKSSKREKLLLREINSMNRDIMKNAKKVEHALKLSEYDQETINSLKNEIEKAWKMVEIANDKDKITKKTIEDMSEEISKLSKMMNIEHKKDETREMNIEQMNKVKDDIIKENKQCKDNIKKLRTIYDERILIINKLQEEVKKIEEENSIIKEENHNKNNEIKNKIGERENIEKDITNKTVEIEKVVDAIKYLENELKEKKMRLDENIRKKKMKTNEIMDFRKKYEKENELKTNLERELNFLVRQCSNYETLKEELKLKFVNINKQISEKNKIISKNMKVIEKQKKKYNVEKENLLKIEEDKNKIVKKLNNLKSKVITNHKNELNNMRKEVDRLKYGNNILHSTLIKHEKENKLIKKNLDASKASKKNIEKIFEKFKKESEKYKFIIFEIEREKEKLSNQEIQIKHKLELELERANILEKETIQNKDLLNENLLKLKRQNELCEKVRKERNFYSKNYFHANESIQKMSKKFNILLKQISQLKSEIHASEQVQYENSNKLEKVKEEKGKIKKENTKIEGDLKKKKNAFHRINKEIEKFNDILFNSDQEKQMQIKEINAVFKDRDVLGNQLIRRDKEINMLYEKNEIQKGLLERGGKLFEQKKKEISLLKDKLKELTKRIDAVKNFGIFYDNLVKRSFNLKNQINSEKNKLSVLKQELKLKINIHRWRYLEGINPEKYEMILKLNNLQKKLINKTNMINKKREKLKSRESQIKSMKKILSRQPGPEIFKQIELYEETLKEKEQKTRRMKEELKRELYKIKILDNRISNINGVTVNTKKMFYDEKKKEFKRKEKTFVPNPLKNKPSIIRVGGGFTIFLERDFQRGINKINLK